MGAFHFKNKKDAEGFKKKLQAERERLIKAGKNSRNDLFILNAGINEATEYLENQKEKVMKDEKKNKPVKKATGKNVKSTVKKSAKPASAKKAPSAKKAAVTKKPTAKKSVKTTAVKKPVVKKVQRGTMDLRHSDKDELKIDSGKPIIIVGKGSKPKNTPKVLKKAAKKGGYTAWDARAGKTFATEREAKDYAADVLKKTGKIVPISPTDRQVTHTFKAQTKADK